MLQPSTKKCKPSWCLVYVILEVNARKNHSRWNRVAKHTSTTNSGNGFTFFPEVTSCPTWREPAFAITLNALSTMLSPVSSTLYLQSGVKQ